MVPAKLDTTKEAYMWPYSKQVREAGCLTAQLRCVHAYKLAHRHGALPKYAHTSVRSFACTSWGVLIETMIVPLPNCHCVPWCLCSRCTLAPCP